MKLVDVLDKISGIWRCGGQKKSFSHFPPMVAVGSRAGSDHAGEIPGHDHFWGGAADAFLWVFSPGIDPAGSHVADIAAQSLLAKAAAGFLLVRPVPDGLYSILHAFFIQTVDCPVSAFVLHLSFSFHDV